MSTEWKPIAIEGWWGIKPGTIDGTQTVIDWQGI